MYEDKIQFMLQLVADELLVNPQTKRKYFTYDGDKCVVHIQLHTNKFTKIMFICDYDEKTDRYTTCMEFKLKNKYSLTFEVMS